MFLIVLPTWLAVSVWQVAELNNTAIQCKNALSHIFHCVITVPSKIIYPTITYKNDQDKLKLLN